MDINKEIEAFLKWHYQAYLLENPEIDMQNAQYIYDYVHKNALCAQLRESQFTVWQAAKAQAIPEGFVLVPKEPTPKMIDAADNCAINGKITANIIYKAMIEVVQEPTND